MTGLLNKIRNEHTVPANKSRPDEHPTTLVGNGLDGKPLEPAEPCPDCHSPTFWRSAYGGELRCAVCDPWPSRAMVGERWTIYTRLGGSMAWVPCLRRGERAVDLELQITNQADGIHASNVDDETGHWLVIWRSAPCAKP